MKTSPEFMVELSVIYSHPGPSTMQKRTPQPYMRSLFQTLTIASKCFRMPLVPSLPVITKIWLVTITPVINN